MEISDNDCCWLLNSGYTVGHGEVRGCSTSKGTSSWCVQLRLLTRWRPSCNGIIWHKRHSLGSAHWHNVTPTSVGHFVELSVWQSSYPLLILQTCCI